MPCNGEPELRDILADPLLWAVMEADGVTTEELEEVIRHARDGQTQD